MKNIPKVNFTYWILMIIATTTGEIVGNYISRDLGLGYKIGASILGTLYVATILYSLFRNKLNPIFYWFLIILGNICGTNIADLICIDLKLGTILGSLLVIAVFLLLLILMKWVSKNKSEIAEKKLEFFYWMAILSSSTFGTTSGDFLSNDTPLGADGGTILLIILLVISTLLLKLKIMSNEIFYWVAIILIHPIGATFGNYISKPVGLDFGNVWTSICLIFLFFTVYYFNKKSVVENQ